MRTLVNEAELLKPGLLTKRVDIWDRLSWLVFLLRSLFKAGGCTFRLRGILQLLLPISSD